MDLTNVPTVRRSLGAAPVRKHDVDGSDFHTLPVVVDDGLAVGDSFDIALHLDAAHPSEPPLFPPGTAALHRALNAHADRVFTEHVVLAMAGMPLNPETRHLSEAEFCRRAGGAVSWEEMNVVGEARAALLGKFEAALGVLARCFVRRGEGPFLEGAVPMYADLILGGWLHMMEVCLPDDEWDALRRWDGGLWGTLFDALNKYAACD